MATQTKGKKKEHIMVNEMLLDFHVSSFFFVHSFDPKKKKKKNTLCKMKKKMQN